MKNTYKLILLLTIIFSSCKAQNAPLYQMNPDLPEGTHFKDLDNDLDNFEGTWKWQSNDSIITIVLQKKVDVYDSDYNQYEDYLIGEYKFTVGNNIIQDYLTRLNDNSLAGLDHYIAGNTILHKGQYPKCEDCTINQRQVFVYFTDPLYEYIHSSMVLRHKIENGIEKMKVVFYSYNSFVPPSTDSPLANRIPFGDYTFIKQ
ncbi:DUF6705 family protein [Psychroserpens luteus]|uniref:DUF6705 family protein n=1 Tax=Psychroserpens luteus TaxID=1434066 RepID=A0ABW5ZYV9_9FLAO|nr:DUF6705 family protein [Psychroserpens luteus]